MSTFIVCGGREFDDWRLLDNTLRGAVELGDTIIQGGAKGADFLARAWAKANEIDMIEFPADWKTHGKAAGGIRNQQMLDEGRPNVVIAFPGGTGTADMVRRAHKAGVTVHVVQP